MNYPTIERHGKNVSVFAVAVVLTTPPVPIIIYFTMKVIYI